MLLVTAVLGVALLMAGCTSALSSDDGSTDVETDMSAEEIQTKATEASESVETATYTQDMTMDFGDQGSIEMTADGAIDMAAEKMRLNAEMDMEGQSFETTQYIIGDQMYLNTNGVWQKQQTPQNIWEQGQYAQQQQALQDATDVEVVDTTTTNGNEVYVMDVDVDEEKMLELAKQQGAQEGIGQMYDQMGNETPQERDRFLVVPVEAVNTSDQPRIIPGQTDSWEVLFGDQQLSNVFNFLALDAEGHQGFEGGEVQAGVRREGVLLFEVDEGFGIGDIDVLWQDSFWVAGDLDGVIDVDVFDIDLRRCCGRYQIQQIRYRVLLDSRNVADHRSEFRSTAG
jgi:outer membrane murein-binding lipoprotein Lpp